MKQTLLLILIFFCGIKASAQTDPVLAGMIALYSDKAESQLKSQEKVMLLQTTGHIWTKEEVEATTDWQRKFNDYLDSFRSVISYAAQIYGFYHEIGKLTENMGSLTDQLSAHPSNALAVALTPRRSTIYRELILGSVDIVNDIRQVCLSNVKMTEKERIEIVFGIRPKLKTMNKLLVRLTLVIKYTTLGDVWREIDCRARSYEVDKAKFGQEAYLRWRANGAKIKPNSGGKWVIDPSIVYPWKKEEIFISDEPLIRE